MLTGVVACPSIMFGTLPDDEVIAAAVDIVLAQRSFPTVAEALDRLPLRPDGAGAGDRRFGGSLTLARDLQLT